MVGRASLAVVHGAVAAGAGAEAAGGAGHDVGVFFRLFGLFRRFRFGEKFERFLATTRALRRRWPFFVFLLLRCGGLGNVDLTGAAGR